MKNSETMIHILNSFGNIKKSKCQYCSIIFETITDREFCCHQHKKLGTHKMVKYSVQNDYCSKRQCCKNVNTAVCDSSNIKIFLCFRYIECRYYEKVL